ncbi:MAG: hypothetical protein ABIB61_03980 [Candidatus Shapirobacteria bacterium]
MNILEEIRQANKKPKEMALFLTKKFQQQKPTPKEYRTALENASKVEQGVLIETMEFITQENPSFAKPFLGIIIEYIASPIPKAKWEAARIIGNVIKELPTQAEKGIPNLLVNTNDQGTVVRWSAAFALGEIIKHHSKIRPKLMPKIEKIIKKEQNSGVKNVYLKAFKEIEKQSS